MGSKSILFQLPRGIRQIQINDLNNKLNMQLNLVISYM